MLSRRTALKLLGGGAGLTLVAACAPIAPSTPTAAPAEPRPNLPGCPGASAKTPAARRRALRAVTAVDPDTLDGSRLYAPTQLTVFQAYDTLTAFDAQRQPQAMLAESWTTSADGKQIELKLRKGVTFHNGRALTSEDVKFSALRVRDPKLAAAQLLFMSNWFSNITTPDPSTVVFKSERPRPALSISSSSSTSWTKTRWKAPNAKTNAVGTGPFALAEWVQGVRMHWTKNKNYWRSGQPYLDELVFTIAPDPQTMVAQLEAGAADLALGPAVTDAARLRADTRYQVLVGSATGMLALGANTTAPPTDNKLVRQALSFAVDRKRFAETTLLNLTGAATNLPWPEGSPAYDATKNQTYTFDLDKAKALFAQAGVPGAELDLSYSPNTAGTAALGQIIQADLAKIGVKLNLKPLELSAFNQMARDRKWTGMIAAAGGFAQVEPGSLFSLSSFYSETNNSGFQERTVQSTGECRADGDGCRQT